MKIHCNFENLPFLSRSNLIRVCFYFSLNVQLNLVLMVTRSRLMLTTDPENVVILGLVNSLN